VASLRHRRWPSVALHRPASTAIGGRAAYDKRAGPVGRRGRGGQPEEVGALVAFLCSPDASYVSGGLYAVDGAATA
jgi:NAD(P)-dependent dehydrogenase (short-subunit alcohol dehydrogenase family)